jgi:anti-anti-sigma factor
MAPVHTRADPAPVDLTAPPPARFSCAWCRGGSDAIWVHATGELDRETAPQLAQALQNARINARMVVLDLRDLTSIDEWGARTVLESAVSARLDRHRQVVVRGPAQVQRVLTRLGVAKRLDLVDIGRR